MESQERDDKKDAVTASAHGQEPSEAAAGAEEAAAEAQTLTATASETPAASEPAAAAEAKPDATSKVAGETLEVDVEISGVEPKQPLADSSELVADAGADPTRPATAPAGDVSREVMSVASPSEPKPARSGKRSALGFAMGSPPTTPTKEGGTPRVNLDLTGRLVKRYSQEVKAAEAGRKQVFHPLDGLGSALDKQEFSKTKDMEVRALASSIKVKLDDALKAAKVHELGMAPWGPSGWDTMLGNDNMKKEFQFLSYHAKNGSFTERYGSDSQYEGDFLNGMRHGQGVYKFRGEVYEGGWKYDKRHGQGKFTSANGSTIEGGWEDGQQHGYCTMTDAKGTVTYQGEFKNGKRHGLGRQLLPSGDVYDGGWKDGRMHDRGSYSFVNGDKFHGMWNAGVYDGPGVFHHADGSVSRRVYKDGRLMSVQESGATGQAFGRILTREGMQRHTAHKDFPSQIFTLSNA